MNTYTQTPYPQGSVQFDAAAQQYTAAAPQFSPVDNIVSTLALASALSIGSNMVDVQTGAMTIPQSIVNGVCKGAAATLILNTTAGRTALQVVFTAGVLATAGYVIDATMKNSREELCHLPKNTFP
ncbi:MAG TPA: hypothetical protein ENK84_06640 [Desulfobulbus sp.]|nr:hypothetical protein [Desulfobulbus sp.]